MRGKSLATIRIASTTGIPSSFAIGSGQSTQLLGLYQRIPMTASPFRCDFGFVETAGADATLRVTVLDSRSAPPATK